MNSRKRHYTGGGWRSDKRDSTFLLGYIIPLLYGLTIAGYPIVSFLPDIFGTSSRTFTVPFRLVVFALGTIALFATIQSRRFKPPLLAFGAFVAFWTFYYIRIFIDVGVLRLSLTRPGWEFLAYSLGTCVIPMLAMMGGYTRRTIKNAIWFVWGFSFLGCLLATLNLDQMTVVGRLRAATGLGPITLGHMGVALTVLSAFILLTWRNKVRLQLVLGSTLLFGLFNVGIAGSRSPAVALLALTPLLLWVGLQKRHFHRIILVVLPLSLFLPRVIGYIDNFGGSTVRRMTGLAEDQGQGESRLYLWQDAWDLFLEHPFFGYSLELPYTHYPHNLVLEAFMATGLFGGVAVLLMILVGLLTSFRLFSMRAPESWVGLLFIQGLIYSSFSGALYAHTYFWCTLGAVLGTYYIAYGNSASRRRRGQASYLPQNQPDFLHSHIRK